MTNDESNTAPKGQNNGLFDESSLDEMQKAENYQIGFKLFQVCFWFMYFFSMLIFVTAIKTDNIIFTVYGIIALAAASMFHIIYSAKVSAKGVMNSKYAEAMSKPYTAVVYTICIILYGFVNLPGNEPIVFLTVLIPYIMLIFDCIFARRNIKILEKMLKEDNEEE